jgi:membrane protein
MESPIGRARRPREWLGVFRRAFAATRRDNMSMIASALAYAGFFAIPSLLLLAVGVFTLTTGPGTIASLEQHLASVMPKEAADLFASSLRRVERRHSTGALLTAVGFVLALWATTSAATTFMSALNLAHGREESRGFFRRRLIALGMIACIGAGAVLIGALLILGPIVEKHLGRSLGIESELGYVWWIAQWPILVAGLLAAFAVLLRLGPDLDRPGRRLVTAGSLLATAVWLVASGALAFYTARFGSYNKTWGTLSAVIVTLLWLWLSGYALLFGAELDAELERSREPERSDVSTH